MPPKNQSKNFWVYILLCENGSYYTGYTDDLTKRYRSHINGTGKCKYTRSFKPITIAQCWQINGDKMLALQLERYIKTLSCEQKIKIISRPSLLSQDARIVSISKQKRLRLMNQNT